MEYKLQKFMFINRPDSDEIKCLYFAYWSVVSSVNHSKKNQLFTNALYQSALP